MNIENPDLTSLAATFPMKEYSIDALNTFIRQRTSPHWNSTSVRHNHYVIIDDFDENLDDFFMQLYRLAKKANADTACGTVTEEKLLQNPTIIKNSKYNRNFLLFVTDCKDAEMTEKEAMQWEKIRQFADTPDALTIFLCTTSDIFTKRFQGNDALYYRFFTRETQIVFSGEFCPEESHRILNREIDAQLPFRRTEAFDTLMGEYLAAVYPTADLKRKEFIADMLRRINSLYYQQERDTKELGADCVPYWNRHSEEPERPSPEETDHPSPNEPERPSPYYVKKFMDNAENASTTESPNVLVLVLSTLPGRKAAPATAFDINNERIGEYYYQMEPVPQMIYRDLQESNQKIDQIFILASVNALNPIKDPLDVVNRRDDTSHPVMFEEDSPHSELLPSALDFFTSQMERFMDGNVPEYRIFAYTENSEAIDESIRNSRALTISKSIVETLHEMLSALRQLHKPHLYVDIHGGLRLQQQILSGIMSLLSIEGLEINPSDVYSVEFNQPEQKGVIVCADDSIRINNFVSGLNELTQYGRIGSLREYFSESKTEEVSNLLDTLESISTDIQFCNVSQFEEDIQHLPNCIRAIEENKNAGTLLSLFMDDIRNTFRTLLTGENTTAIDEIIWCIGKGFYQQALSLIEAKMPEYLFRHHIIGCDSDTLEVINSNGQEYNSSEQNAVSKMTTAVVKNFFPDNSSLNDIPIAPFVEKTWNVRDHLENTQSFATDSEKWKITFTLNGDDAATVAVLHAVLKKLRNKMNHPTQTLPFHLNANIVKARIQEYLDAVSTLECKKTDSSTAPIYIEAVRSVKSDTAPHYVEAAKSIKTDSIKPFTFSQKEFDSVKLPDQNVIFRTDYFKIRHFAKMVLYYAQKTNQVHLKANVIDDVIPTCYRNNTDLDVYEKEEMFKSEAAVTSATLVHTLAQAFPMCFKEESDHSLFIAWH